MHISTTLPVLARIPIPPWGYQSDLSRHLRQDRGASPHISVREICLPAGNAGRIASSPRELGRATGCPGGIWWEVRRYKPVSYWVLS